jgi:hypothetical protein
MRNIDVIADTCKKKVAIVASAGKSVIIIPGRISLFRGHNIF